MTRSSFLSLSWLLSAWVLAATAPAAKGETEVPLGPDLVFAPYGQFHFAYQAFDDGLLSTENIVDISNANSRFGFYLRAPDSSDGLYFHFETGLGFRPSQKTSQIETPPFWDWQQTDLRIVQIAYAGRFGTFKFGQGKMPTDGAAEVDLGKTVVVAKSTIQEANGAYIFRTPAGALSSVTIGQTFSNLDGGRQFRVRYDTPDMNGFTLAAAYGIEVLKEDVDDKYADIALRYTGQHGRFDLSGAAGFAYVHTRAEDERVVVGSFSVLDRETGLNLSLASGHEFHTDASYIYLKAGWNTQLIPIGVTKFVSELHLGRDRVSKGSKSRMWSVGLIQEIENANTETYVGYRAFSYDDRTPVSYLDAGALQIGARVRF